MRTARQLVRSLAVLPSGFLSDNFGRKVMIVLSVFSSILAVSSLLFVREMPFLLPTSIFQGLYMALWEPSRSAYVVDVMPGRMRGAAYATIALAGSFGSTVAMFLGRVIADVFNFC